MPARIIRIAITVVLVICFGLLMRESVLRGDMQETQNNASKMCLSCIGLN